MPTDRSFTGLMLLGRRLLSAERTRWKRQIAVGGDDVDLGQVASDAVGGFRPVPQLRRRSQFVALRYAGSSRQSARFDVYLGFEGRLALSAKSVREHRGSDPEGLLPDR